MMSDSPPFSSTASQTPKFGPGGDLHFVFVRFWRHYTDRFPYEEFDSVPDEAIDDKLLSALAKEVWKRRHHRDVKSVRRRRAEERAALDDWAADAVVLGASAIKIDGLTALESAPRETADQKFARLAEVVGWLFPCNLPDTGNRPRRCAKRICLLVAYSAEEAEAVVAELRKQPQLQICWDENPHYFYLGVQQLSRAEMVAAMKEAKRIGSDVKLEAHESYGRQLHGRIIDFVAAWRDAERLLSSMAMSASVGSNSASTPSPPPPPPESRNLYSSTEDSQQSVEDKHSQPALASKVAIEESSTDDPSREIIKSVAAEAAAQRPPKRSTTKGEGRAKVIAALSRHHRYAEEGCLVQEPIGCNALARLVNVAPSTVSDFFKDKFGSYINYQRICGDNSKLIVSLKVLNDEFTPKILCGGKPPVEDEPDKSRGNSEDDPDNFE